MKQHLENSVAEMDDYSDGDVFAEQIDKIFGVKIKTTELGFWNGKYLIMFWTGRKPGKVQTNRLLLQRFGVTLEDLE